MDSIAFLTPHMYIFKLTCHHCIFVFLLKEISLRMATLMQKHVGGTSQSD